ncbi:hypothetical protein AB0L65_00610 [Nonomuraea sp. NPDC052116]|uniref:hypothetical protein n=1 Tax=Nonomuraea sp. NPDC052116 TaxID=3155665 RepID=UPI00344A37AA
MAGRDALTAAVIAAGRDAAGEGWDGAHRMYALTDRDTYLGVAYPLDPLAEVPPDALLAIPLTPLGPGDLGTELAKVTWPHDVHGCVLVTEVTVVTRLGRRRRGKSFGVRRAQLAVGVLRDGYHRSLLRLRDEDEWRLCPDSLSTDGLVTALAGTF